jgi:hypothetical protein
LIERVSDSVIAVDYNNTEAVGVGYKRHQAGEFYHFCGKGDDFGIRTVMAG